MRAWPINIAFEALRYAEGGRVRQFLGRFFFPVMSESTSHDGLAAEFIIGTHTIMYYIRPFSPLEMARLPMASIFTF